MKYLPLALLICALLSRSNAYCYRKHVDPDMTHCKDDADNTWHAVGSSWRNSECMDCSCGECCSAYSTPVNFSDDCVKVFDAKACEYIVHKKNDPTMLCPVYGAVGK